MTGLKPGEFVHMMGNTHVYENHVEPLKAPILAAPAAVHGVTRANEAPASLRGTLISS